MSTAQWLAFLPAALLVAASPGASNLLAFANGTRAGWWPSVLALLGRSVAFALMIGLVLAGLGVLLATSVVAFAILKWLGVAYLVWLGIRLWRSDAVPELATEATGPRQAAFTLARREFWVAMGNPKAVLLFTAFIPQFVDPRGAIPTQLVALGAAYIAIELVTASLYAAVGSRLKAVAVRERGARLINRVTGGMMLGAAIYLATAERPG